MELVEFHGYVRDVLAHLYDIPYLETHPLAGLLSGRAAGEVRGHALQRVLLDAIQALRPSADVPYQSLAWRKYRYLYLRYVQCLAAPEIADDLAISPRQSRRYSLAASLAITQILWDENARHAAGPSSVPGPPTRSPEAPSATVKPSDVADYPTVDQEVARLAASAGGDGAEIGVVVAGVVALVRPLVERRGVSIRPLLDPTTPAVTVERAVLRQSLVSLVTLSVELGSGEIELATRVDGDQVVVSVAGSYPDPTAISASLPANERWQVVRHLLESQGATLEMQVDDCWVAALVRAPALQGHKVLVVDDNPDVVQLYRRYLSGGRYQVFSSTDGRAGLVSAESEQPAIVVLDLMMPAQDGWEVLQLLKSNPATRRIPVVVCSVLKERDLAFALGAADFLPKPVTRADLISALERYLNPAAGAPRA